jgi:hypothetical protein
MNDLPRFAKKILVGIKEFGAGAVLGEMILGERNKDLVFKVIAEPGAARALDLFGINYIKYNQLGLDSEKIALNFSPDLVITGASIGDSVEKRLIDFADKNNISVYVYIDAFVNCWQRFCCIETGKKWRYMPTKIMVPNQVVRKRLFDKGFPLKDIVVYQHPIYFGNKISKKRDKKFDQITENRSLGYTEFVVTLIHETGIGNNENIQWDNPESLIKKSIQNILDVLELLFKEAEARNIKLSLYIKLHPTDRDPELEYELKKRGIKNPIYLIAGEKHLIFLKSNIIVGVGSMLLYEAAEFNPYVFSLKLTKKDFYPYSELSAKIRFAKSAHDLWLQFNQIIFGN